MWIDISWPISPDGLLYPEDSAPVLERVSDMNSGEEYNLTVATLSLHSGTHLDSPRHFFRDGATIDELPVERFICRAHVVDLGAADCARVEHLEGRDVQAGDAVLFKSWNAALPRDRMAERWVYISIEAAQWCVDRGVGIVGMDYIEVESPDADGGHPVHHVLLGAGVLLLENIDLCDASAGEYQLICLPVKFMGCEAAPCRAVLGEWRS